MQHIIPWLFATKKHIHVYIYIKMGLYSGNGKTKHDANILYVRQLQTKNEYV